MVSSSPKQYALPNSSGKYRLDDLEYSKLLDASKYVVRAKEILLKNENFDTRECTLYIARKKWMHGILAPLIGLCNGRDGVDGDDLGLTMRCCGLAIVLIKRLSDSAMKFLADASGSGASKRHFKRKAKASLVISNDAKTKKPKDDDAEDDFDEAEEREKEDKVELVDKANRMEMANNAKQQGRYSLINFRMTFILFFHVYLNCLNSGSVVVVQRCAQQLQRQYCHLKRLQGILATRAAGSAASCHEGRVQQ